MNTPCKRFHKSLVAGLLAVILNACGGGGGGGAPTPPPPPPPPVQSNNANLATLSLDAITLVPAFQPAVLDYTASTDFLDRTTNLTATLEDATATIQVDGIAFDPAGIDIDLAENANVIQVVVTAEDGTTTRTYSVTVTRESGAGQRLRGAGGGYFYRVDEQTGETEAISGDGLSGITSIDGVAYDPDNNIVYGSSTNRDALVSLDPVTGAATVIGPFGFGNVAGLAYDRNSDILYGSDVSLDQLITIDVSTGAGTAVGPFLHSDVRGLAYDPNTDTLYGFDADSDAVVRIDTSTGSSIANAALPFTQYQWPEFRCNQRDTVWQRRHS